VLVDGIRGIAAVGIACYHIHRYGPLGDAADRLLPTVVSAGLSYSWIGVQCFLVIAGFVAAHSLRKTHLTPSLIGNFALRRMVRLGFAYWAIVLVVLGLNEFAIRFLRDYSLAGEVSWHHALAQFLFVQDIFRFGNISAGLWFVAIDLQFGMAFILLVGLGQWLAGQASLSKWPRGIALLALTAPFGAMSAFYFNLDANNDALIHYYFHLPVLGALAWWALDRKVPHEAFWIYSGALLVSLIIHWRPEIVVATIAGVALYLAGHGNWLQSGLAGQPFQYLGRTSYSLFLVHYPVSWIILRFGYDLTGSDPTAAVGWLVLAFAGSLGAAHAFFHMVEAPANRLSRRLKAFA
jgi:peptidoglycan/LPS O-acetylase OafA/YrhL